ncbi:hypothetical protein SCH01S_28_00820 [Sphingomonas changbaiensis NBRC 104936]|uniref:HNH nuclease domain-containing protein n=1 Tax=Sphingomonas changbaiensis NBRC 104936 TaxID=1219043 RepID=A0A0E9MNY9_9SPHN|nr:HNH endonuclease [Sphingomonas changbaiensis]GAO39223.1 hypothetical protein SCH01S_28_00820 [Sphingomonas changbaiensis NBRC 104936]
MAVSHITKKSVLAAIAEHDRKGETAFLKEYGFDLSRDYWLIHNGRSYVSKAIANVAQAIGMGRPFTRDMMLSGGVAWSVRGLQKAGFQVHKGARPTFGGANSANERGPKWTREELILALELYMRNRRSPPGKGSAEVAELSQVLNLLALATGVARTAKYRNRNGVYLKMMNFRRFDPQYTSSGRTGMARGGKLEEPIWTEFANRLPELRRAAALIRGSVQNRDLVDEIAAIGDGDDEGAVEGGFTHRLHRVYERDRKVIEKKKRQVRHTTGALRCEVCELDFRERYGAHGDGYIEVHHKRPVFQMRPGERTKPEDLALLCANCHRMVHRTREPLPVDRLIKMLTPSLST